MAERYVVRSGQGESPLPEENMENVENVKSVREEKSPKCVEVKKKKPLKGCIFLSIAQSALLASTFGLPPPRFLFLFNSTST